MSRLTIRSCFGFAAAFTACALFVGAGSLVVAVEKTADETATSSPADQAPEKTPAKTAGTKKSDAKTKKPVTSKLSLDETAAKVEFFEAIDKGDLEVVMIPQDSKKGNLFVENTTDQPLTVIMPDAFVGVQVLKQYGGGGGGFGGGGGGFGGGGGGIGGAQATGGGSSGGIGGSRGGGGGRQGGGVFSVPPEKIVRVGYDSVCLEHGKTEPSASMRYRVVRVEQYSDDAALKELIARVGNRSIDSQVAQAAAWHLGSKMSWEELASKMMGKRGLNKVTPYFRDDQLAQARTAVATVHAQVAEKAERAEKAEKDADSQSPRTRTQALNK